MVVVDVILDQFFSFVENVQIVDIGFGFFMIVQGNVIVISQCGVDEFGFNFQDVEGQGVIGINWYLKDSFFLVIVNLILLMDIKIVIDIIMIWYLYDGLYVEL